MTNHTSVLTELIDKGAATPVTFDVTHEKWALTVDALCDTGASMSSIDSLLADFIGVEVSGFVNVKNANGKVRRGYTNITFDCAAGTINADFTIADRRGLAYPVILGRDVLFIDEEE